METHTVSPYCKCKSCLCSSTDDDFIVRLLAGEENKGYDYSPTSFSSPSDGCFQHDRPNTNLDDIPSISRDNSSQILSVVNSKRPSSIASGFANLETSTYDVDDHVTSILSYGAYGILIFLLAVMTTIILVCFG